MVWRIQIVACRFYIVYRQVFSGPVDPSFRTLSGRIKLTVRRDKFNNDPLSWDGTEHSLRMRSLRRGRISDEIRNAISRLSMKNLRMNSCVRIWGLGLEFMALGGRSIILIMIVFRV